MMLTRLPLTLLLGFFGLQATGQTIEGVAFDKETRAVLQEITIINKRTGTEIKSEKNGHFYIQGAAGDTLSFFHSSYLPATVIMPYTTGNVYRSVFMEHLNYRLKEATITSRSKYEQDSLYMRKTFQHAIDYNQPIKPEIGFAGGLVIRGLFSALAEHLLGQTKRKKKFLSTFAGFEQSMFVDTRYTPQLVSALTNLPEDSTAAFMNTTPMPYDFARTATDLELKMWIRYNYKQWLNKIKDSTYHVTLSQH